MVDKMFKVSLEANLKSIKDFAYFKYRIRKEVIENGLDKTIGTSITELKNNLRYIINEKIPAVENGKPTDKLNLPKSDNTLIEQLTGIDLTKLRSSKDYTTAVESKALVVDDYRVRFRLPIGPFENVEENFEKAVNFFNNAILIFNGGDGKVKYLLNPGIDLRQYVKIVCSRDQGVTDKSSNKFEHYKNSIQMTRQIDSELGRFAEWSLKQEGVRLIQEKFINITPAIDAIKEGNFDEANLILGANKNGIQVDKLTQKVQDLEGQTNVSPTAANYSKLVQLVRNLKLIKFIQEDKVTYELKSDSIVGTEYINFIEEMKKTLTLWLSYNEAKWFKTLVQIAEKVIKEFEA